MEIKSNFGAAGRNLPDHSHEKKFITTAISYTNGSPHIGHAYEFITADVLARFCRIFGYDTFFLTGADEHGQKVAASAAKAGKTPSDHCDFYVAQFKSLDRLLNISYDRFIRTTDTDHMDTAQVLWEKCMKDIYLDKYEGWYNEREECFVTESEAELSNFLDPSSGLPLKKVEEESYFFRMSEFCEPLKAFIQSNSDFIQPEQLRNHIIARLDAEGLKDLSISRTSFSWGIPVPNDSKHVMYVWFDALTNYLSGVGGLNSDHELSSYWPPRFHIIGKDIIWFHCVIWPCMLMSAKLPLPECVFSHGFVNASDGRKMSKSFGNTIDPFKVLEAYSADSIRYYVCSSVTYGSDLNFSEEGLIAMHNNELADVLGNLVNRVFNLCQSYCNGLVPDVEHDGGSALPFDLNELRDEIHIDMNAASINLSAFKGMGAARNVNGFLQRAEPWKLKGPENDHIRKSIVRTTLEAIYILMHFLAPILPNTAEIVFDRLNTPPKSIPNLNSNFYNLKPGTKVVVGPLLFNKIEVAKVKVGKAAEPVEVDNSSVEQSDYHKLDFRVGKIIKVWDHPLSEKLYCEEIDVGEIVPRTIVSGIKLKYKKEDLIDRFVVVLCNIKEAKVAGTMSSGLLLTAVFGTDVEIIEPPSTSNIGEKVRVDNIVGIPLSSNSVKKNKIWETVKAKMKTNAGCEVLWNSLTMSTTTGPCKVVSLQESDIN